MGEKKQLNVTLSFMPLRSIMSTQITLQKKKVDTDSNVVIHYQVSTPENINEFNNTHIVLLHGLGGDLNAWKEEVKILDTQGFPTIVVDLRGHGLSSRPSKQENYSLSFFEKDVLKVIQAEKIKKPLIVGHCFGGMVAISLVALNPDLASGLILVDTSYKPPFINQVIANSAFISRILKLIIKIAPLNHLKDHVDFKKFKGSKDINLQRFISDILHTSLKSYLAIFQEISGYNASSLLGKISVPTLVVQGQEDTIFPPQVARELKDRIKKSQLKLVPEANHIIVINNPKKLTDAIVEFIKAINKKTSYNN